MRVLLYTGIQQLPFSKHPVNPIAEFDPESMGMYIREGPPGLEGEVVYAKDDPLWPMLVGIVQIKSASILAHVSVCFEEDLGEYFVPEKVGIQFSTGSLLDRDNIPVVVSNGKPQVAHLWGIENRVPPLKLAEFGRSRVDDFQAEIQKPCFWSALFKNVLSEQKQRGMKESDDLCVHAKQIRDLYEQITWSD